MDGFVTSDFKSQIQYNCGQAAPLNRSVIGGAGTGRPDRLYYSHPLSPLRGFSLVELLVVIAVIGVLVALLLPAIQMARESARRTHCFNNLKQIGVGVHNYLDARRRLPPGGIEWRPPGSTTHRQLAWSAFILPYLEEQALYDRLDLKTPFDSPQNASAAATVLPVYVCPSSRRATNDVGGRGPCDYGGMFGERITGPNNPPNGTMLYDVAFRISQISDGTSKTILIAEDSVFSEGQWINGRNVFDQAFAINAAPLFENDMRSDHPDGANALLVDGSVHLLTETLELRTLAALCTRAKGDSVGEY